MVQNRVQKETHTYTVTLFLTKALKQFNRERKVFLTNGAGTLDIYMEEGEGERLNLKPLHLIPYTKVK